MALNCVQLSSHVSQFISCERPSLSNSQHQPVASTSRRTAAQWGCSRPAGRSRQLRLSAASVAEPSAALPPYKMETVADIMTSTNLCKVTTETSLDEVLDILVSRNVTGLPVVDAEDRVVGVVSDYDMLAMEGIADAQVSGTGIFPEVELSWATFNQVQRLIHKTAGKKVGDVMTEEPVVVRAETNMAAAAKMLLEERMRRLPVVDAEGRLLGILTRRDVLKAALKIRKARQGL